MVEFTIDDVFKLAKLSNISVSEMEAKSLVNEILEYVSQLQKLDLAKTAPTYQVTGLFDVMRTDEEFDYKISAADLFKNVPETQDNYIKVRRVL